MNDFFKIYNEKKNMAEEYISTLFKKENFPQENLREIMEYAVLNGGKRIRPVLMMSAYEIFSEDVENILPFCGALELIHSYSLVHDDLPAMDNDTLRRGKPTCHIKFSHFGAILAGDALLNMAFEIMANNINSDMRRVKALCIIAEASGAKGMVAGQMSDMEGSVTDFSKLSKMCSQKTGALLKAAVLAGAALGGADDKKFSRLSEYSELLGLIFQIKDDILDATSTDEIMGKNVGSDEKNSKITFVSQYGIDNAIKITNEYKNKALGILDKIEGNTEFLKKITEYMADRVN